MLRTSYDEHTALVDERQSKRSNLIIVCSLWFESETAFAGCVKFEKYDFFYFDTNIKWPSKQDKVISLQKQ